MRLFIAFDVSKEVEEHLKHIQKKLDTDSAKLTFPQSIHNTLKFLGDVTPEQAENTRQKLKTVTFESFTAQLNNIGFFPNDQNIRVVWAGLEPEEKIQALQKQIDNALDRLFEKEKDYKAHLTLARVKNIVDKTEFCNVVNTITPEPLTFLINSFKLIESTLTPEGPVYKTLEEYSANV